MNLFHRWFCRSGIWKNIVATSLLPWVLEGIELGCNVLEIGPGPGVTTDQLCTRVGQLTCVEVNGRDAASLARRTAGQNVTVLHQDATAMTLPDGAFDGAICCTMLHHIPSPALQDQLLREVARVLRPGGVFAGIDSRYSRIFGLLHLFDTMVPVLPETFAARLEAAGFKDVQVTTRPREFRFHARR